MGRLGVAVLGVGIAVGLWLLFASDPPAQPTTPADVRGHEATDTGPALVGGGPSTETPTLRSAPTWPRGHARIEAQVVDPQGQPVAGVPVTLRVFAPRYGRLPLRWFVSQRDPPGPALSTETSDADGRVRFDELDATRQYALEAVPSAPLALARANTFARVSWPRPERILVIPGTPLTVQLIAADGRARAGSAELQLELADWEGTQQRYWYSGWRASLANGKVVFPSVPAGSYRLNAVIPEHGYRVGVPVRLPTDAPVVVKMAVEPGAVVQGTVRDEDGNPLADAAVVIQTEPTWRTTHTRMARSKADGTYRIEGLSPAAVRSAECSLEGRVTVRLHRGEHTASVDAPLTLDFELLRGALVTGHVRSTKGEPIAHAHVHGQVVAPGVRGHVVETTADGEGRFRLGPLPPGNVLIVPHATGFVPTQQGQEGLLTMRGTGCRLVVGSEDIEQDLLMAPGVPFGGRVLDAQGRPLPGALVILSKIRRPGRSMGVSCAADADGRFLFPGLPESASHPCVVAASTRASQPFDLLPGTDNVFRLPLAGSVSGRVAWKDTAPTGQWWISARSDDDRRVSAAIDPVDGTFQFRSLEPGTWTLCFEDAFREPVGPVSVRVAADRATTDVVLQPPKLLSLEGTFVDATGEPLGSQHIRVSQGEAKDPYRNVTTTVGGRFRLDRLVPGRYRLWHRQLGEPVFADAGARDLRLEAAPARVFRGTVTLSDGRPLPRGALYVYGAGLGRQSVPVVDGAFAFEMTSRASEVRVELFRADDAAGSPLSIRPYPQTKFPVDRTAKIELTLARRARVTVVDTDGRGIQGALVMIHEGVSGQRHSSLRRPIGTDQHGVCEVLGLPDREVSVRLQVPPGFARPAPSILGGAQDAIRIVVARGGLLRGRAFDPDGNPVAEVRLTFRADGRQWHGFGDDQGRFTVSGMPTGLRGRLTASVGGRNPPYAAVVYEDVVVGTQDITVRFARPAKVTGRVLDPEGKPIRCRVHATRTIDGKTSMQSAQTQRDGSFEFVNLLAGGTYNLSASRTRGWAASEPVEITPPATDIVLRLRDGPRLEGRVEGENVLGVPVVFVWYDAEREMRRVEGGTNVGPDGTFRIVSLRDAPGALHVLDSWRGRYALLENVQAPRSGITLTLKPAPRIAGRVEGRPVGARGGSAVASSGAIQLRTSVRADGTFEFKCAPPGTYDVAVTIYGYKGLGASVTDVEAGTLDVVVKLPKKEASD